MQKSTKCNAVVVAAAASGKYFVFVMCTMAFVLTCIRKRTRKKNRENVRIDENRYQDDNGEWKRMRKRRRTHTNMKMETMASKVNHA